jgi:hypothetical protein
VIYLSPLSGDLLRLGHPNLGCMRTPDNNREIPPGMPWAADCGIKVAMSSDAAAVDRYLRWLDGLDRRGNLFATTPDVLGDADACWARSEPLFDRIRDLGYRPAFVAQDGFEPSRVDPSRFRVLFIGGKPLTGDRRLPPNERRRLATLEWKRSEAGGWAAIRWALANGLEVHVGRVNGGPFLHQLAAAGVRSADGTNLTYAALVRRTLGWLDVRAVQPSLGLDTVR